MAGGAMFGRAVLDVAPDLTGFRKDVTREVERTDFAGTGKKTGSVFGGAFTKVFGAIAVAKIGQAVGKGVLDAIGSASDLSEALNVVSLTFGDAAGEIEAWADTSAEALGQSKTDALAAASSFGGLLTNLGFAQDATVGWSQDLTGLASDLASAFNTDPAEAAQAIGAALRGESEPLRRYNVLLTDAAVRAKAVELGLAATAAEVDENGKAQARLALIMEQTALVQGDFANTSDGVANRQRIIAAQVEDLKARIGAGLLPVWEALLGFVSKTVIPIFNRLGPIFDKVGQFFSGLGDTFAGEGGRLGGVLEKLRGVFADVWPNVQGIIKGVADTIRAILAGLAAFWNRWGDTIMAVVRSTVDTVATLFKAVVRVIRGVVDVIAGIFTGDWRRVWDGLKNIVGGAIDAVVGLFTGLVDRARIIIGDVGGAILDALKSLPGKLFDLAGNIIGGLVDGIKRAAGNVIRAIKEAITDRLPGFVKDAFGIGSPSKLFADLGAALPEGFARGITGGIGDVERAAARLVADGVTSATAGVDLAAGALNVTPLRSQVITVELDGRTIARAALEHGTDVLRLATGIRR